MGVRVYVCVSVHVCVREDMNILLLLCQSTCETEREDEERMSLTVPQDFFLFVCVQTLAGMFCLLLKFNLFPFISTGMN